MSGWKILMGLGALGAMTETGIAVYLFRRTMLRQNTSSERTQEMAGTDWEQYIPKIREKKHWIMKQDYSHEWIESGDGLKLHGMFFPCEGAKKTILCLHGYSSSGMNDFSSIGAMYLSMGYNLLIVDHRAHGKSEGEYIGFGCLDRYDVKRWIRHLNQNLVPGGEIILHGISMGAATAVMTAGLCLPGNVKGVIADCAFSSPWEVFSHVLKSTYHLMPLPIMTITDAIARQKAGYGFRECDACEEVKKAEVPFLFIHGDADTFVPSYMTRQIYEACKCEKDLLIVPGAGHAEAYYKDTEIYEQKVRAFLKKGFGESHEDKIRA